MSKKFDFSANKKWFAKVVKNNKYRHKKRHLAWLKAQGFSEEDYDSPESMETIDLAKLWSLAKGRCQWCNEYLNPHEAGQDHLIPISKGGSNGADNIVLCCADCNARKATKHPARFAAEQKVQGISTSLIELYLEKYNTNPGIQQILSDDFIE